jgi:cellulose synthase/poly-beta-1,6-N-acetylglucosamine synthase-like glycosyltransferase
LTCRDALAPVLTLLALALFALGGAAFAALLKGCFTLRRMARERWRNLSSALLKSPLVPAVAVLAAPEGSSAESLRLARRLLDLEFGKHELVVALDGPSESDLEVWAREFRLYSSGRTPAKGLNTAAVRGIYESRDPIRLTVVDKERGGQDDALNAAINATSAPLIAWFDPRDEFTTDALLRLVAPMLEEGQRTIAACGFAPPPPAGGVAGLIGGLESLRLWLGRCAALAGWNRLAPVPGAATILDREAVRSAGGFRAGILDLVVRLHRQARASGSPYRVALVPEGISHPRAPRSLADLRQATLRDQREIARAARFGWHSPLAGLVAERLLRPLVETVALILTAAGAALGWVDPALAGLVLLAAVAMGMVISMAAVVLRELAQHEGSDPGRLAGSFFAAIPENLGYRQWRNLWLIAGCFKRREPRRRGSN